MCYIPSFPLFHFLLAQCPILVRPKSEINCLVSCFTALSLRKVSSLMTFPVHEPPSLGRSRIGREISLDPYLLKFTGLSRLSSYFSLGLWKKFFLLLMALLPVRASRATEHHEGQKSLPHAFLCFSPFFPQKETETCLCAWIQIRCRTPAAPASTFLGVHLFSSPVRTGSALLFDWLHASPLFKEAVIRRYYSSRQFLVALVTPLRPPPSSLNFHYFLSFASCRLSLVFTPLLTHPSG